jgi:uncharacterized protein
MSCPGDDERDRPFMESLARQDEEVTVLMGRLAEQDRRDAARIGELEEDPGLPELLAADPQPGPAGAPAGPLSGQDGSPAARAVLPPEGRRPIRVIEVRGGELLKTLKAVAAREDITNAAIVTLIGAADRFTVSTMPAGDATKDVLTDYDRPAEMTGTGQIRDGKPHVHVVMAVEGDWAVAGHLHPGGDPDKRRPRVHHPALASCGPDYPGRAARAAARISSYLAWITSTELSG